MGRVINYLVLPGLTFSTVLFAGLWWIATKAGILDQDMNQTSVSRPLDAILREEALKYPQFSLDASYVTGTYFYKLTLDNMNPIDGTELKKLHLKAYDSKRKIHYDCYVLTDKLDRVTALISRYAKNMQGMTDVVYDTRSVIR